MFWYLVLSKYGLINYSESEKQNCQPECGYVCKDKKKPFCKIYNLRLKASQ